MKRIVLGLCLGLLSLTRCVAADVSTMAALRATLPAGAGGVTLKGYYAPGDFGAAETFVWDAASTASDDGCTVIRPAQAGPAGRWLLSWDHTLTLRQCGAKEDGAFNDGPALATALAAAATRSGTTVILPCGAITLQSSALAPVAPFAVPNNTTLRGESRDCAVVTLAGRAEITRLFQAVNPRNVWFDNFTLVGNSTATHSGERGAIFFSGTASATGAMQEFGLRGVALRNFAHDYWVAVENASGYDMKGIVMDRVLVRSGPGNDRGPGQIVVPSDIFEFRGQMGGAKGIVDGVSITAADADGEFVKVFAVFWSGTRNGHVTGSVLRNFGAHAGSDAGGYTLLTYDDSYGKGLAPTSMWFTDNTIIAPRSCGWYGAGAVDVHVNGNTISGQSDAADQTIPKGAIAFNQTSGEAVGNTLRDNRYSIVVTTAASDVVIKDNRISSSVSGGKGIYLDGTAHGARPTITLDNNSVEMTGAGAHGLLLIGSATSPLGVITVQGGRYAATYADVFLYGGAQAGAVAASVTLSDVVLAGAPSNAALISAGAMRSPIALRNITVDGRQFAGASGVVLNGAADLSIDGLRVENLGAGQGNFALSAIGARGTIRGVTFSNVDTAHQTAPGG